MATHLHPLKCCSQICPSCWPLSCVVEAEILKLRRKREKLALDISVEMNNNAKKSKIRLRKDLKKEIKQLIKSLPGFTGHNRWMVVEPELSSDSD